MTAGRGDARDGHTGRWHICSGGDADLEGPSLRGAERGGGVAAQRGGTRHVDVGGGR